MTVYFGSKHDAKRLSRTAKRGDHLFVLEGTLRRCRRCTVTSINRIFGGAMCGSMSVESLLYQHGPIFTPGPDGTLSADAQPFLTKDELRDMEEQIRSAQAAH